MRRVLITNRRSRANRKRPQQAEMLALGLGADLLHPETLGALDALAPQLGDADEVFVHGGDGTLHRVLTAMYRAGVDLARPSFSIAKAGTMNIVADSLGQRWADQRLVDAVAAGGKPRVAMACPMTVEVGASAPCLGFLAGGGIISRFLEVYYETPDPSPAQAGWLLARGAASSLVGGALSRRLTRPFDGELRVDGVAWEGAPWTAVALGTVEQLGLGFRPFPGIRGTLGQVHVIGIGSGIAGLAFELPRVWLGRGVGGGLNREATATKVVLASAEAIPFMVDGDVYVGSRRVEVGVHEALRFHVW